LFQTRAIYGTHKQLIW